MTRTLTPELMHHCTLDLNSLDETAWGMLESAINKRDTFNKKLSFLLIANVAFNSDGDPMSKEALKTIYMLPRNLIVIDAKGDVENGDFIEILADEVYEYTMSAIMMSFESCAKMPSKPAEMDQRTWECALKGFAVLEVEHNFLDSTEFLKRYNDYIDDGDFGEPAEARARIFEADYILSASLPLLEHIVDMPQAVFCAVRHYAGRGLACESLTTTTYRKFMSMMINTVVTGVEAHVTGGGDENLTKLKNFTEFMLPLPSLMREIVKRSGGSPFASRKVTAISKDVIEDSKTREEVIEKLLAIPEPGQRSVMGESGVMEMHVSKEQRESMIKEEAQMFSGASQNKGKLH